MSECECVCCDQLLDLNELILINGNIYKCAPCIKNEKIVKRTNWVTYKADKLVIINNLISELDNIDILDDIAMNNKIRQITDVILEMKYFIQ